MTSRVLLLGVCGALASAVAAGCGSSAPQDAHEPQGHYTVRVAQASFPAHQSVARPVRLALVVRNTSARTLPNVTVAVTSFDYLSNYPNLANRKRPVWVVDQGPGRTPDPPVATVQVDPPGSGTTANYNVWALGPLPAGATRSFVWQVTPVKPGLHRVFYRVVCRPQRQGPGAARQRCGPGGQLHGGCRRQAAADPRGPADRQGRARSVRALGSVGVYDLARCRKIGLAFSPEVRHGGLRRSLRCGSARVRDG